MSNHVTAFYFDDSKKLPRIIVQFSSGDLFVTYKIFSLDEARELYYCLGEAIDNMRFNGSTDEVKD